MGSDDHNFLIGLAVAFLVAVGADVIASRFSRRVLALCAVAALLAASVYGTFGWLRERPRAHFANPTLSQSTDLFGHTTISILVFAMPVLVGLGSVAVLPGTRLARPFRLLVTGAAVFGSLYAAIILVLALGAAVYRGGP
ncbi:MAG TPA: hypothetical protein VIP11_14465 [Gemmatimonadaceae bacterium]